MTRASGSDDDRLAAVRRASAAGDLAGAATLAEAALRDGLNHPMLVGVLVARREQQGRFDEALALLRQLKATLPPNVPVLRAIGLTLLRLDRLEDAVAEFDEALAVDPCAADVLAHRAMALTALSRIGDARRDFEAAAAIDPTNVVALNGLAGLALRRGEAAEARRLADLSLAQKPGLPSARLTVAGADLSEGRSMDAEQAARKVIGDNEADVKDRAVAFGLLGESLDAQRRFEEAFAAWSEANTLLREAYRSAFEGGPGTLSLVRSLTAALRNRKVAAPALPTTCPARQHAFLLGFPRSGTTLLEQALEEHPDIVTMPERDCLVEGSRQWLADGARLEALCAAGHAELEPYRDSYWARVRAEGIDAAGRVFVDKNPFNSFRLPLIARLFPGARILLAERDPRDVVLSCFRHRFQMSPAAWQLLTLEGAAALYDAAMELAEVSEATFALKVHRMALESVVADFDGETARICEFLGVEWTPRLRDFGANAGARDVATPSGPQLVRGLNARGIGKWRNYERQLAPVLPLLAPWIERFEARVDKSSNPT
jgi:tetratricopeptide (TPR) repeat protein